MSTIPPSIVNQAVLIHGRIVYDPPPLRSFSVTDYSRWQGCACQGSWILSEENLRIASVAPISIPHSFGRLTIEKRYHSEITKIMATWTRHTARPSMNPYEEEEVLNVARRAHYAASWVPRAEIFDLAMGTGEPQEPFNGIVSLSVDPVNAAAAQIDQVLYYSHRFIDISTTTPRLPYRLVDFSSRRADPDPSHQAPILPGYFDPHAYFGCSTNLFTPEFAPSYQPDTKTVLLDNEQEVALCMQDIERDDLRERMERIATAFFHDRYVHAMYVTMVDRDSVESPQKSKYLRKE